MFDYGSLFYFNPLPCLVYDLDTLQFIEVNQAAIDFYGYSRDEFLNLALFDISLRTEKNELFSVFQAIEKKEGNFYFGLFTHQKKDGVPVGVALNGHKIHFSEHRFAMLVCQEYVDRSTSVIQQDADNLLNSSLDVITSIDEAGKFIKVSAASIKHWGYLPEELEGRPYLDLVHPEDIEKTNFVASEIIAGKKYTTFENRYLKKNGEIVYNLWSAHWDPESKIMYAIARDAFEKRAIEQLLVDSESRFKSLVQEGLDLIGILDAEGNYSYVSPTSKKVLGIEAEVFIGKSPFEFIHPEDAANVLEFLGRIGTEDRVEITPFRFQNSSGEWRWIKTVLTNMLAHPSIKGIVANSRDITDQIKEQNRLKLLESVVTNTSDAIIVTEAVSADGTGRKILYVNEAFTKMTGYSASEVIGKSPSLLQGSKSDKLELARLKESLSKYEPCEITTLNYKKNGDEYWVNFSVNPIVNEKGQYTHWVAIERDITEKKVQELEQNLLSKISQIFNKEKKLKKATQHLCEIFADYGDFDFVELWIPNLEQTHIHLLSSFAYSSAGNEFYSYSASLKQLEIGEGLIGKVGESKRAVFLDLNNREHVFVRREASEKAGIVTVLSIPLLFKDTLVGVLAFGSSKTVSQLHYYLDIFKRLETFIGSEINRKSLENDLLHLFKAIPDIICITDLQGRYLKINKAGCDLLGYTEEELLFKSLNTLVHPDDKEKTLHKVSKLGQGEKIFKFENRYVTKKGDLVWLSWTCNSEVNEGLIYASAKNITKEKKLSELNAQAASLSKIGSWEIDLIENKLFWTDIVHELHETDPKSFTPSVETAINFYREDFREVMLESIRQCITTGKSFSVEAVIITFSNKERWVKAIGQAEMLDGKCIRVFGSFQDIDEKRETEEKLVKSFEEKSNILESIGDAFFALDKNWVVTYWNKEAEKILGRRREEVLNISLWESYSDAIDTDFFRQYHIAMETGETVSFEAYYPTINKWFEVSAYPSKEGLSVYFKDVTLRKEADIRLLEANERFEMVTQATNDAIWDWDIKKGTFFRSHGIENFFGEESTKSLSTHSFWKDNFYPDDLPLIQQSLDEAIHNPSVFRWEMEYRILNKDKKIGYVVDKGLIIRDTKGKAIRMVGAMTDISERKLYEAESLELNESLKRHTEKLEKTNEQLEQFAFIASHDLQEPLRMVTNFLEQLRRKYENQLDDKAKQYIFYATDGAKRMRQIILDLLEYSRVGKIDENLEYVDLNEILSDYKLLRSKIISEKHAVIRSNSLPEILVYRVPLIQTLHSLLDNAIKYSRKGQSPKIEITALAKDGKWIISIADNGIGIEKEYFDKIFVIFQRLHNREEYEGTGIGLSLSKKHVESWGGNIWIESKIGFGTTIYFSIPKQ